MNGNDWLFLDYIDIDIEIDGERVKRLLNTFVMILIDWWGRNMFNNLLHTIAQLIENLLHYCEKVLNFRVTICDIECVRPRPLINKKSKERQWSEKWHQQLMSVSEKKGSCDFFCWTILWKITCHWETRVDSPSLFWWTYHAFSCEMKKRQISNYMFSINL